MAVPRIPHLRDRAAMAVPLLAAHPLAGQRLLLGKAAMAVPLLAAHPLAGRPVPARPDLRVVDLHPGPRAADLHPGPVWDPVQAVPAVLRRRN